MLKIPRIIHRIWLGKNPMPEDFVAWGRTWEQHHPGWEFRLWTDDNLPQLRNARLLDALKSYSGKSNVIRYEILSQFGGVYVDTDFECLRNIEPLLNDVECFAGVCKDVKFENGRFPLANTAIIGCVPGHPFMEDLVANIEANVRSLPPDVDSPTQTGPIFFTSVLHFGGHRSVKLFPVSVFYPYAIDERWRRDEAFPEAYAVHHWALSHLKQPPARRLSQGSQPCLSVALHLTAAPDAARLQWVLEGLCDQSVEDFEILVAGAERHAAVATMLQRYATRLRLRLLDPAPGAFEPSSAQRRNLALAAAAAPRILFLDSDCMPDRDFVETHAVLSRRDILLYGFRRVYPVEKFFAFRDLIDRPTIVRYSQPEQTDLYVEPALSGHASDMPWASFSVQCARLRKAGGFTDAEGVDEVKDLARRLHDAGCASLPSVVRAMTTWMAPTARPASASTAVNGTAAVLVS